MRLLQLLLRQGAPTSDVLGERAQIGLACAAGRVNVGGLDSWLALVEQPPRTDEAPETAGHSQDVPQRFARARERTREPRGATNAGVFGRAVLFPADLSCVSRRWRRPRLARQSPRRVCALGCTSPRRTLTDIAAVQGGQRLVRPEGARELTPRSYGRLRRPALGGSRRHGEGSMSDRARRSRRGHVNRTSLQTRRPRGDDSGPATSLERRLTWCRRNRSTRSGGIAAARRAVRRSRHGSAEACAGRSARSSSWCARGAGWRTCRR